MIKCKESKEIESINNMYNDKIMFLTNLITKYGTNLGQEKDKVLKDKRFWRMATTLESMINDGYGIESILIALIEKFSEHFKYMDVNGGDKKDG